jgi:hypothetical protein
MTRITLKFSVNTWQHLYSLQQAITHAHMQSGNHLQVHGKIRGEALLDKQDTAVELHFFQSTQTPVYAKDASGATILGQIQRTPEKLRADIQLDARVFEELRKNLREYTAVDGIHIVVTLELALKNPNWPANTHADIIALDYAMKGDA